MGQFEILRRTRDGGSGIPEFLSSRGQEWVFETREAAQSEVARLNRERLCDSYEGDGLITSASRSPFSYHVAEVT